MAVVTSRAMACALGGAALATLLALGACAPEVRSERQARAEAQGTAQPLGSFGNANFGVRQSSPGYLYDRGGSNAGASLLPRGDLLLGGHALGRQDLA
jgi:hypothetical protein